MKTDTPPIVYRSDYRAPAFEIVSIALSFALDPSRTRVKSRMAVKAKSPNPGPLKLNGEHLSLKSIAIDGRALAREEYALNKTHLTIKKPPVSFVLETEVEIDPSSNSALSGLYLSKGILCTQCEAEGFRRITYFLDRPDVMSVFSTRIEADASAFPVLLSNGNLKASGKLADGRHFAEWHDPYPKPSYLFALVAGKLGHIEDHFTTASGRKVTLRVFVDPGNEHKAHYAMDALKRAMRWDEEAFGREYDLDIFMIVAVSAFNFGAMENKGLNIFNDKFVLASPETATDHDFALIESVVAHEYFHNWTGNRITCRDWFQLCLKEGLTVFRDQQFSADMNSAPVKRISDVKMLRLRQFPEDQGPLAHPPRPDSFMTIDNFYTATVYEKGAEICRMLKAVLGDEGFRRGMDLYFARHDGQAATVDEFRQCFADANGADLAQFSLWWSQAGTPTLDVKGRYDENNSSYILTVSQSARPTPWQNVKAPFHIPLRIALLDSEGVPMPLALEGEAPWLAPRERVLHVSERKHVFRFTHIVEKPTPSLNRGFGAPVVLKDGLTAKDRAFLMARDNDLFNRWEAGNTLSMELLLRLAEAAREGKAGKADALYLSSIGALLADAQRDRAFTALAITLPSEQDIALASAIVDPDAIHTARSSLTRQIAKAHHKALFELYQSLGTNEAYLPNAEQSGRRALRNACLRYLTAAGTPDALSLAQAHFERARNMTDMAAALGALTDHKGAARDAVFSAFYDRFKDQPLVIDKWMTMQAVSAREDAIALIRELTEHPAFTFDNPNRFRALVGAFALSNPLRFHAPDGAGYRLVADMALELDRRNPQVAARVLGCFESWRRYDKKRQTMMKRILNDVRGTKGLSRNSLEIAERCVGAQK